jgi:hypothetical protein
MVQGSNQPLTERSTRNFPRGKKRQARRSDNLAAICEPNVCKLWEPQPLTSLRATTACTGIALPYSCMLKSPTIIAENFVYPGCFLKTKVVSNMFRFSVTGKEMISIEQVKTVTTVDFIICTFITKF